MRALAFALALAPAILAGTLVDLRATATLSGARLRIAVREPGRMSNIRRFAIVHEHPMHLFVVGEGLEFFAHEHPAPQQDGVFLADVTLPRPGPYMAIVEFQPEGGSPQMVHQAFTTGNAFGRAIRPAIDRAAKVMDGVRVSLDTASVRSGASQPMTLRLEDAATGAAIPDLQPYLGAAAHLIAVSSDMTEAVHEHPAADPRAAAIVFRPLLPRAGVYKVWVQFQRGGRLVTASFVMDVP